MKEYTDKIVICDACGKKLFAFFDDSLISVEQCDICLSNMYKEGWDEALESSVL